MIERADAMIGEGVVYDATSLTLPPDLPFERWETIGATLRQMERSVMWWIGDWLLFGERKYGETYAQAVEATGYEVQTIKNASWVAGRIESSRRRDDLSWSHHAEVAALAPAEQDKWLDAAARGLSQKALRDAIQHAKAVTLVAEKQPEGCAVQDLQTLIKHGKRFRTIVADPPWRYGNQGTRAATDNHYPTMSVDEIAALPVADLAHDDAHLHLWTTNAFLFDCKAIMEAWGFEYKSAFVWCKPQMGIGNYWRVSHEYLLLGVRGRLPFANRGLMSWAAIDRGEHSSKPDAVRMMIEKSSPGPRLELFGRSVCEGWTVWGNEIDRCLFYQSAESV